MPTTNTTRAQRFYQRGLYHYERGQWLEATSALRDAIRLYPEHIAARMHPGASLVRQRLYLDAIKVLEEGRHVPAIDDVTRLKLLKLLSTICVIRQDYPAAEYYLTAARALAPEDPVLIEKLASLSCKAGSFEKGFDLFLQAARERASSAPEAS